MREIEQPGTGAREEPNDAEWAWVAQSYRATPVPKIDTDAFVDRLMQEIEVTADIPSAVARPRLYRRGIGASAWAGIAAALVLVFAGGIWVGRTSIQGVSEKVQAAGQQPAPTVATNVVDQGSRTVQFVLSAPQASRVTLVGDFNGWDVDATPMVSRSGSGLWTVSVSLPAGRHVYAFVVDGDEWMADPAAPQVAVDAFGSSNSVVIVGGST